VIPDELYTIQTILSELPEAGAERNDFHKFVLKMYWARCLALKAFIASRRDPIAEKKQSKILSAGKKKTGAESARKLDSARALTT